MNLNPSISILAKKFFGGMLFKGILLVGVASIVVSI